MRHAALEQLCTLVGGFDGADGRRHATIPGTNRPAKVDRRDRTPRNPVGDVAVIGYLAMPRVGHLSKHFISLDI